MAEGVGFEIPAACLYPTSYLEIPGAQYHWILGFIFHSDIKSLRTVKMIGKNFLVLFLNIRNCCQALYFILTRVDVLSSKSFMAFDV